jgi:HD-like signal output (HDOD) protein
MFLGVDTIQTLVLSAHIFSQYESMDIGGFSMTELMEHSMGTGRVAKKIAAECGGRRLAEEAFVAGMLHDAGKLILAANFPDQYRAAMKAAIGKNMAPTLAEREYFKADHADVGGYLLGLWGLPAPIVEAIALHHSPSRALHKSFNSLTAVHVADFLSHEGGSLTSGLPQDQIDTDYLDEVGVLDKLEDWKAQFGGNEGAAPD